MITGSLKRPLLAGLERLSRLLLVLEVLLTRKEERLARCRLLLRLHGGLWLRRLHVARLVFIIGCSRCTCRSRSRNRTDSRAMRSNTAKSVRIFVSARVIGSVRESRSSSNRGYTRLNGIMVGAFTRRTLSRIVQAVDIQIRRESSA